MASPSLLVRAGGTVCALPLSRVVETMRRQPVRKLAAVPPWVAGTSVIRGRPVPVVDLRRLLRGDAPPSPAPRLVVVHPERPYALGVDEVLEVVQLGEETEVVPILSAAASGVVEEAGTLDGELLVALAVGRVVPDEVYRSIRDAGGERGQDEEDEEAAAPGDDRPVTDRDAASDGGDRS